MNKQNTRKINIGYCLMQGSFWMAATTVFAFASVFLVARGFSSSRIGLILAIGNVLAVLLQSPLASFADRTDKISLTGITRILGIASIASAVFMLLFPKSKMGSAFFFVMIVMLFFLMQPLTSAVGMHFLNRGVSLNFGLARGVGSLAFALASFILGICAETFGADSVLISLIAAYTVFVILTFFLDTGKKDAALTAKGEKAASSLMEFIRTYHRFVMMLAGVALLFTTHNILNNYLYQIMQNVGGESRDMGFSVAVAAASEIPTMLIFSWLLAKAKCRSLIRISALFFSVKSMLFMFSGSVGMIHMAQLTQCLAFALYTPASVYYVNEHILEKDHVKGQALATTAITVGGVLGNLIGGQMLESFGAGMMLTVGAVISLVGTVIVWGYAEEDV